MSDQRAEDRTSETPRSAEMAAWWEHPEHEEFINELLDNAPDRFDGDEAAEEIVVRYVRALEQAVRDLARWAKQQGADLSLFAFEGEDDPDWQSWMLAYELTRFDGSVAPSDGSLGPSA